MKKQTETNDCSGSVMHPKCARMGLCETENNQSKDVHIYLLLTQYNTPFGTAEQSDGLSYSVATLQSHLFVKRCLKRLKRCIDWYRLDKETALSGYN